MVRRLLLLMLVVVFLPCQALAQEKQDEELEELIDDMIQAVEEIRKLEVKKEFKYGKMTEEQFEKFVREKCKEDMPPEKLKAAEKAMKFFRLIPKDCNLKKAIFELLGKSVAAFYDHKKKRLHVIERKSIEFMERMMEQQLGVSMEEVYLFHEILHAAQDQNFNLTTLPLEIEYNDDLQTTTRCLIEGDAIYFTYKFMFGDRFDQVSNRLKTGGVMGVPGMRKIPIYLKHSLTLPYSAGYAFVLELKKKEIILDNLYKDLPSSTEQILHPEKYIKRDYPTLLKLPDLKKILGEDFKHIYTNTLGEFTIRYTLREKIKRSPRRRHRRVAEGWDGDRFSLFEDKENNILCIWFTTWDTQEDATEFFEAYRKVVEKKYENAEKEVIKATHLKYTHDNRITSITVSGKDVVLLENIPKDIFDKLSTAVKTKTTREELKKVERVKPKKKVTRKEF